MTLHDQLIEFYQKEAHHVFTCVKAVVEGQADEQNFIESYATFHAQRDIQYSQKLEQEFAKYQALPPPPDYLTRCK